MSESIWGNAREAVTVLDEPFHRETIAALLNRMADRGEALERERDGWKSKAEKAWGEGDELTGRAMRAEKRIQELERERDAARAVVRECEGAIASLEPSALGYARTDEAEWPIRDELLSKVRAFLASAARVVPSEPTREWVEAFMELTGYTEQEATDTIGFLLDTAPALPPTQPDVLKEGE